MGKDNCAQYRDKVDFSDRIVAVAGLFNTGTNLLDIQLMRNLRGVKRLWQVPWGKHRMAEVKWNHTANEMENIKKENVLPIVIVRDPLAWLHLRSSLLRLRSSLLQLRSLLQLWSSLLWLLLLCAYCCICSGCFCGGSLCNCSCSYCGLSCIVVALALQSLLHCGRSCIAV